MPAYITHAISAEDLYFDAQEDIALFKVGMSLKELKTYALGVDLALPAKSFNAHNQHTQAFFLNLIKYVKDNKLYLNSHVLAFLYGHISHYFLDVNVHPFVFYLEKGCQKVGLIKPHNLVEGYISSYLCQKILKTDITYVDESYFNRANIADKEIAKMINTVYKATYGADNVSETYRETLNAFIFLEKITKNPLISKDMLIKISGFKKFLTENNLLVEELINEFKETYLNPVTGSKHSESFIELYALAIEMTLDAIFKVNQYLYGNASLDSLKSVFTDLSYDTGVPCEMGKKFNYVKQIRR